MEAAARVPHTSPEGGTVGGEDGLSLVSPHTIHHLPPRTSDFNAILGG